MKLFGRTMTKGGVVFTFLLLCGAMYGGFKVYHKLNPEKAKTVQVTTKASSLPPLAYDKNANAPLRALPSFNDPATVEGPEVRGELMGWNAQMGIMYAVGGKTTSTGSICQELSLNIRLDVQNATSKQAEDLYAFAEGYHNGDQGKGCHFIGWMGDGVPNYLKGLNDRLIKDFGADYIAQVVCFAGSSFGEDKWLLKPKYVKDARGSLTCTVLLDGDFNIAVIKSQMNGWPINFDRGTYDPTKVNFISAPNDDYMEAAKFYVSGQKVTLKLVKNGKVTDKDTTLNCTGVATWFPGDYEAVKNKGGLVTAASTADFGSQMACAIICIKKWAQDNRKTVESMVEAFGRGGDQVKSHDEALRFSCKVAQTVFADDNLTEDDYYRAYLGYDLTDDDGNTVKIGGSRVFNLADMCNYVGITGSDKYKSVYNTFGNIDKEAYPEILSDFYPYEEVTDWSYIKAVYLKNKSNIGTVSKEEFTNATMKEVVGDANYSIEFETGSSVIRPSSFKVLDNIVNQLTIADNLLVEISGHTDNTGSSEPETRRAMNQQLSEARANSVRQYLTTHGNFDTNRMTIRGYGEAKPIAENNTSEGRQKNRRVEIKLGRK